MAPMPPVCIFALSLGSCLSTQNRLDVTHLFPSYRLGLGNGLLLLVLDSTVQVPETSSGLGGLFCE